MKCLHFFKPSLKAFFRVCFSFSFRGSCVFVFNSSNSSQKIPAILPESGRFFFELAVSGKDKIHCDITGQNIFWSFGEVFWIHTFLFYDRMHSWWDLWWDLWWCFVKDTRPHITCWQPPFLPRDWKIHVAKKASITLQAPKNMAGNLPIAPPETTGKHTSVYIHFRILSHLFVFSPSNSLEFSFDS